jgi:hypothetical protein
VDQGDQPEMSDNIAMPSASESAGMLPVEAPADPREHRNRSTRGGPTSDSLSTKKAIERAKTDGKPARQQQLTRAAIGESISAGQG